MPVPLLLTKLYLPPPRPKVVLRPHLIERLNEGLLAGRKLTLISAPAGFGKTTLASEWISALKQDINVSWLSLDEADSDRARFLSYFIAALQTISPKTGEGMLVALQSPQPPPIEAVLTILLNEISAIPDPFLLVLDDYHLIDDPSIDAALTFLVENQPPQMHLVIATREDPHLPLARLRARGLLTELRLADLRFNPAEAAEFLNQSMELNLSAEDITALEIRTEGWIAGLQLAALSMQGQADTACFITSFTGSHHFVLDYLLQEVLQRQPKNIQNFLLGTSVLDRLCGPLCDAVLMDSGGQGTLEYLEHTNLFIIRLDNERRWYRYHHLFRDLLRQRLQLSLPLFEEIGADSVAELHIRASQWYEDNGLALDAFYHAVAAPDIDRAARLVEDGRLPLLYPGALSTILSWLGSLPDPILNAHPVLWLKFAELSLMRGITTRVEEMLHAAETGLTGIMQDAETDDKTRDLVGQIAVAWATLSMTRYQAEAMITHSRRALEYLPDWDLSFRATAFWLLGVANTYRGDRIAASQAYSEAIRLSQKSGDAFTTLLSTISLAEVQEMENQLYAAAETFQRALKMSGEPPLPNDCEAHLGLARIYYQWDDLETAEQYAQQSVILARQYDKGIDRFILCELFLAHVKLARRESNEAAKILAQMAQTVQRPEFTHRLPEVAAEQIWQMLQQGNLPAADQLPQAQELPISRARVYLAQGDPSSALMILEPLRRDMETKGWADERLKVMALQAIALQASGEQDRAMQVLGEALALAEPGGFIRLFVDEGESMAKLLSAATALGILPDYIGSLLAAFGKPQPSSSHLQPLVEPLSSRELEILRLLADGLSNREISERLFLAIDTVKGHNRRIFDKLGAERRTEAIARARQLGLI